MSTASLNRHPNDDSSGESARRGEEGLPQALQENEETAGLLSRAGRGDRESIDALFSKHRTRLRRMVQLRMAQQLRGRVDASDVIQEAFFDASRRLERYLKDPPMPFFLWLRYLTRQKLLELHRHHVGTKARDPRREVSLHRGAMPEASTEALAAQLLGHTSTPSEAAIRVEMQVRLQEALNSLDPLDREILALRHFEQLSNVEAARELGIAEAAASKRFIRALLKLKGVLTHLGLKPDAG